MLTNLHTTLYLYVLYVLVFPQLSAKYDTVTTSTTLKHGIMWSPWPRPGITDGCHTDIILTKTFSLMPIPAVSLTKGAVGHNYNVAPCSFQAITRCISTAQRTILSDSGPPPNNTTPFSSQWCGEISPPPHTQQPCFSSLLVAANVKNNPICFPVFCPLFFALVLEVHVPCKLDRAYSKPFMAFTWLLLKRANPNSWEKTEQEITSHEGDV